MAEQNDFHWEIEELTGLQLVGRRAESVTGSGSESKARPEVKLSTGLGSINDCGDRIRIKCQTGSELGSESKTRP
ncbi:hypothetical protein EVAR_83443_1 [Eumeta japonica]|uniref:Uncharacterized protein n=1 Tax=Eumeta variegata TaxID=151549 RepID=A0A4C1TYR4_EUMVA|nr:hypothetical protein EVAR_83443_1 [Eumeta japonica]